MTGEATPGLELKRPFPTSRIGNGVQFQVAATPEECAALTPRMGLEQVESLVCSFDLRRGQGGTVEADGVLRARVRQVCVVSLESFAADVIENFSVRFVPEGQESEVLDIDSDDEIVYRGDVLELGEAAAEQLALALDPFPKKPGAALPLDAEAPAFGPFATLAKFRLPN